MRVTGKSLAAERLILNGRFGVAFAVGCSVVGLMATLKLALAVGQSIAQEDRGTIPLSSSNGFTVDVPADWQQRRFNHPTNSGGVAYANGVRRVSLGREVALAVLHPSQMQGYTVAQHPDGQIYYVKSKNAAETSYRFFIRVGQRAAELYCNEPPDAGNGPGACLTIARTARFEAPNATPPAPRTTAVPSGPTAPHTSRYGLTLDVPSDWNRSGEAAQSSNASGQVIIHMATQNRAEADRQVQWAQRNSLQSMEHPNGVIYYDRNTSSHQAVGYEVVVDFRRWAGRFSCRERLGTENGPAGCLNIARSARFAQSGTVPPAAATASPGPLSTSTAVPASGSKHANLAERTSVVPFNSYRGMLLTVRDIPTVMSDRAALTDATRAQVNAEQNAWRQIDGITQKGSRSSKGTYELNPKKPAFTLSWQSAVASDPKLADRILQMFLRSDTDWSAITDDPAWDNRYAAATEVFMFDRDRVVGREPGFAANELAPVYRRHLEAAATQAPTELWIAKALPAAAYDFDRRALRFLAPGKAPIGGRHTFTEEIETLDKAERPNSHYTIPARARVRANYMLFGVASTMQKADPPVVRPGVNTARSPLDAWRTFYQIGSSWEGAPMVELLALDRRVELTAIPIDARKAETLAQATGYQGTIGGLTAKIYFHADHVELSERTISRKSTRVAVLFANVQKVDVHDDTGELIASFSAASLPEGLSAPPAQTAAPPVTGPVNPTSSQAERARERQQQVNQGASDRMAQIRARNQVAMAVQREAQRRVNTCIQQAAGANSNQSSPAYQQAVQACTQKAKRMGTCVQQADQAGLNPLAQEYKANVDSCVQQVWK